MRLIDVITSPWAIIPEKLIEVREIYLAHTRGEKVDWQALESRLGKPLDNHPKRYDVIDDIAVIPIEGVIAKKMNLFHDISGGTSTELIGKDFVEAIQDESIKGIVLNIDSPGGAVDGTPELAHMIYHARGIKPVIAYASGSMASAAYWIGAAADEIYLSSEVTQVGSIGVVATHVDVSGAELKKGIRTTEITAGKYKRIASQYNPLTDEGKAVIQEHLDHIYGVFIDDIVTFRDKDTETVLNDMADGRVFIGKQAIKAGLVDGIKTFDEIITMLNFGGFKMSEKNNIMAGDLTAEQLAQKYPNAYAEIKSKGYIEGIDEGMKEGAKDAAKCYQEGMKKGAEDERKRIQDVEAQTLAGHEALIKQLKFDGRTTGPEAAIQVLNAEREKKQAKYKQIESEAIQPVQASSTDSQQFEISEVNSNLPIEERAKAEWEKSQNIRTEFLSYESYLAYKKAAESGRARILSRKGG